MCQFWTSCVALSRTNLYLCEPCDVFGHFRIGSHVTSTLILSVGHSRSRFGGQTLWKQKRWNIGSFADKRPSVCKLLMYTKHGSQSLTPPQVLLCWLTSWWSTVWWREMLCLSSFSPAVNRSMTSPDVASCVVQAFASVFAQSTF